MGTYHTEGTAFVIFTYSVVGIIWCIIGLIIKYIKFKFPRIELVYEVRRNQ